MTEINRDFYCAADGFDKGFCSIRNSSCGKICPAYNRKWPTPEQFREEYGKEYPDNGAVYCHTRGLTGVCRWHVGEYEWAKTWRDKDPIVCACTPWGKPPANWRLE